MNKVLALIVIAATLPVAGVAQKAPAPPPAPETPPKMVVGLPSPPAAPQWVRKVVELKHLAGPRLDRAAKLVNQFMHPVGSINYDGELKTAVLLGPPDVVAGAEALLRKFDTPVDEKAANQVQFTIYLVEALPDAGQGGPVPPAISSAVDQMKKTFHYGSYRLLETIFLQAQGSGVGRMNGLLPEVPSKPKTSYSLSYRGAEVLENRKTVSIPGFEFILRTPADSTNHTIASLLTDLTVQEGQKLVVGKLSGTEGQSAIFLIITTDIQ